MSTDKTLANAQPGGMVRLGTLSASWRACADKHDENAREADSIGDMTATVQYLETKSEVLRQVAAELEAALSAQPSQGGQGDAPEIEQIRALVSSILSIVSLGHQKGPYAYAGEDFGRYLAEATRDCRAIRRALSDLAARQPVGAPVAWQSMATCPRDGTAVLLRWGEDHVSPGWWCAAVSPIQNEDGTWPRETGGFPWAFFDMNDGVAFVNHAVDTEYGPTHWAPYVYPAAQAVDLGQFREAVLCWAEAAENDLTDERGNEAARLLGLINSSSGVK